METTFTTQWAQSDRSRDLWKDHVVDVVRGVGQAFDPLPHNKRATFVKRDTQAFACDWAKLAADLAGVVV